MYNRYIPQPDGSYCRNRMESKPNPQPYRHEKDEGHKPTPPPCNDTCSMSDHQQDHGSRPNEQPISGFLQNLLPKNLDTGDLIVILLLLLLAGDCEEDRSTAMLTLAIYLFL
jgi:hypothetical protein